MPKVPEKFPDEYDVVPSLAHEDVEDDSPIGIILALPEEEQAFTASGFVEIERGDRIGLAVRHGTIDRKPVVMVQCGIGKVNAAIAAMMLIREFYCGTLIMAGVAGALDESIRIGDVVVGTRLVQHDYGALIDQRIKAFQPGSMPLPGMEGPVGYLLAPELLEKVKKALRGVDLPPLSQEITGGEFRMPKLHFGTIVSGDTFINCPITRDRLAFEFGALAVEMEGAAIAQVAARFNKPLIVIRGVSDLVGRHSHIDFPAFVSEASASVATIVRRLAGLL